MKSAYYPEIIGKSCSNVIPRVDEPGIIFRPKEGNQYMGLYDNKTQEKTSWRFRISGKLKDLIDSTFLMAGMVCQVIDNVCYIEFQAKTEKGEVIIQWSNLLDNGEGEFQTMEFLKDIKELFKITL